MTTLTDSDYTGSHKVVNTAQPETVRVASARPQVPSSGNSRSGFTLTELLAVLAVIAILIAILFPLFRLVKQFSYRVQCASNMRQLGHAFMLYADDWDGYWPCPGGLVGDRSYWAQSGNGGLNPYVHQRGLGSVWCCPLLQEWGGKYPARSYSMNSYLRQPADCEYPGCRCILCGVQLSKLTEARRTVLLYEGVPLSGEYQNAAYAEDQVYYIYRCANWSWARGYYDKIVHTIEPGKPWHGDKNNYLYCDGHIAARPPGKKTSGLLSTYEEMYEWYVDKSHYEELWEQHYSRYVSK